MHLGLGPRHARACMSCMFLTLSLYLLMHVSIKSVLIYLLVCRLYMTMYVYIRLPVHEHSCACLSVRVCLCVCVCVCVCVRARVHWSHVRILYSGRRTWTPSPPPPRVTNNPSSAHCGSAWLSIHLLKIVQ